MLVCAQIIASGRRLQELPAEAAGTSAVWKYKAIYRLSDYGYVILTR